MLTEQLIILKEYLVKNLQKGWIVPNGTNYKFSVLFVKKPNGGLRLYIDYREVNSRICKDWYFVLLISETLKRISQAYIFTKLNIRQAFNKIKMDE